MAVTEKDISLLRKWIMDNSNFSDSEKHMIINAMTVAMLRHEQKESGSLKSKKGVKPWHLLLGRSESGSTQCGEEFIMKCDTEITFRCPQTIIRLLRFNGFGAMDITMLAGKFGNPLISAPVSGETYQRRNYGRVTVQRANPERAKGIHRKGRERSGRDQGIYRRFLRGNTGAGSDGLAGRVRGCGAIEEMT